MIFTDDNHSYELSSEFEDRLIHYLSLETWPIETAYYLLVGLCPEKWELIGFYFFNGKLLHRESDKEEVFQQMDDIERLFRSDPEHGEFASPAYWINWARKRQIPIPWYDYAHKNGLLPPDKSDKSLPTANRNDELQKDAVNLAREWRKSGRKEFSKREIADALASSNEWKEMTSSRIERIIHKTW